MARLIESSSAQVRLEAARAFVETHARDGDVLLVGASRGAVDDLARSIAARSGATIGLHRFSLTQLAARVAAPVLAGQGLAPVTYLGSEAVAARATFDAQRDAALTYFAPVARTPGFPRALARTLQELRLAGVGADRLGRLPLGGRDLSDLLERFDEQFANASATDRATLFDAATQALRKTGGPPDGKAHLLLLDVPIDSSIEFEFLRALLETAGDTLITVPFGDLLTLDRLASLGLAPEVIDPPGDSDLTALRRYLFSQKQPPERTPSGDVKFFSAPGEGRECVEIARRILLEARGGVPFDEMAVFLRAPQRYIGLLEHALKRAGVPAWFDRGTQRPHPAGRAFLAILACACEQLSARRFAEYLSLAQVPNLEESRREPAFMLPDDEELSLPGSTDFEPDASLAEADADPDADADSDDGERRIANRDRRTANDDSRRPADSEPRTANPEGGTTNAERGTANDEPRNANGEPRTTSAEPRTTNPGRGAASSEPRTPNLDRGTGNAGRGTANAEPGTTNGEPRTANPEPRTENQEPRTANAERGTANGEPRTENLSASDEDAIVAGTLRAPWKWETLIVESAVIGGDPQRWHRRLAGWANELRVQREAERKEDPDSPRVARIERDLRNLAHLRAFALPIVDRLAAWPKTGTWGEWLDRFAELAPIVLRQPERVLRVVEQLRPMAAIGPISLDEARDVIADRLQTLELDPPKSRYGRVFVGSPHQARGRSFRVVFVAGLAERMFPQRPHEDPMLLDREMRVPLAAGLTLQDDRARTERLLLRLAVGAPSERLWLSYPRLEMAESRPRVPSFYALDVMRAITGRIPQPQQLQDAAATAGGAGLAWPAPAAPADAIDDLEHDLSVLRQLLQVEPRGTVRGHAHYLLQLNEALKRSVSARWARGRSQWTPYDGITRVTGMTQPLLQTQRLGARPYSLSALQKYSTCPYQFLLSAIYRLEPPPDVEPLQKLDPLTRGSIFHEVQAEFFRALKREQRLPIRAGEIGDALATLDRVITRVADKFREDLAPAIDRVWRDEINDIARDLHVWARRLAAAPGLGESAWQPEYFEFAFGLPHDEGRDPASVPDPVLVDGRFKLRGSVDLIEQRSGPGTPSLLRITDHKTGRNRTTWKTVIGGGAILQPVLYSLAVEQALNARVGSGRLFYCTSAGGFVDHEIPINDANRRAALEALEIIDRAIELGFLPAAPGERACTWCDFRPVCGPDEVRRVRNKAPDKLGDLESLREQP